MKKVVKTGIKQWTIEHYNAETIGEILKEYRGKLIDAVLNDLSVYIQVKNNTTVSLDTCAEIRASLQRLKESEITSITYGALIDEILSKDFCNVASAPFYGEIDSLIVDALSIAVKPTKRVSSILVLAN
jgi:hypothetical protein